MTSETARCVEETELSKAGEKVSSAAAFPNSNWGERKWRETVKVVSKLRVTVVSFCHPQFL